MRANEYGDSQTNMEEKVKASSKPGKRMNGRKAGRKKCYIDSSSNKQMKKQERRDGFGSEVRELK